MTAFSPSDALYPSGQDREERTVIDLRKLLAGLREVMAASSTPQARLDKIVQMIAQAAGADVCSLYLLRGGDMLELYATQGLSPKAVHQTRLRLGEGLVGLVAATSSPLSSDCAPSHPNFAYRPETEEDPYLSFCGVPLVQSGKVRGVLVIQHRTAMHYSDDVVETLQTVAMLLAELAVSGDFGISLRQTISLDEAIRPRHLSGHTLNAGLAMGRAVLLRPELKVEKMVTDNPAHEAERLTQALAELHSTLGTLLKPTGNHERDEVLEAYRMIATDRGWIGRINEAIRTGLTAEAAVLKVAEQIRSRLNASGDAYLRDRLSDFEDLSRRLIQHLAGPKAMFQAGGESMPRDAILVASHLGPAEMLDHANENLRALVLEEGAITSHVVIVARALGIPVIGQCTGALERIEAGDELLVDADNGQVLVRPVEEARETFIASMAARQARAKRNSEVRQLPSVTADGAAITLNLNCGLLLDLPQLDATQADGVGLYRTEIPFLARSSFPSIDMQVEIYRQVMEKAGSRPVTFRTLDVGGDKFLHYIYHPTEENPALGWRGLRIGLDRPFMLRQQLRALVRAAAGRELRVMFPLVSDVSEFKAARKLVDIELDRAKKSGQDLPHRVQVGVMLEIPALALQLPAILAAADFISVGSNDLMQFMFGADRGNRAIASRYDTLSPAMLKLLRQIHKHAHTTRRPLTLCGEMAGDPLAAMALIGLGYRSLSLSATSFDAVKIMLRSLNTANLNAFINSKIDSPERSLRPILQAYARDHGVLIENFRQ